MPLKTSSKLSVKVFEQMTVSSEHIIATSMDENITCALYTGVLMCLLEKFWLSSRDLSVLLFTQTNI